MDNRRLLLAKLGALLGAAVWGAFWVPVRMLAEAGLPGIWPVAVLYATGAALLLPALAWRWRRLRAGGWRMQAAAFLLGSAMALYATAFLYTEVVPAVLLFYLCPVWGFLLGRVFLGDPITPPRWAALVLALGGAAVALGPESWPPMPRNAGDWMALASGMFWMVGATLMLVRPAGGSLDYGLSFFVLGAGAILAAALLTGQVPQAEAVLGELPWVVPVVLLLILPGCLAVVHGSSVLNPGVVGILFMVEIAVTIVLAAALTDEPIGWPQILGCVLIALAGAAEGLWGRLRQRAAGLGRRRVAQED